jgi:hypothetical protein
VSGRTATFFTRRFDLSVGTPALLKAEVPGFGQILLWLIPVEAEVYRAVLDIYFGKSLNWSEMPRLSVLVSLDFNENVKWVNFDNKLVFSYLLP